MKFISKSVEQTIEIGKNFAETLVGGDVILVDGDLGAGKTHFAKGVATGLGVTDTVTSPTFTLHNVYQGEKLTFNHFDFYRMADEDEAYQLGLSEIFYDKNGVSFVEWWQNVEGLLPDKTKKVSLKVIDDRTREIEIHE